MAEQKKHWWDGMKPEDMTTQERIARYYGSETPPGPVSEETKRKVQEALRYMQEAMKKEQK